MGKIKNMISRAVKKGDLSKKMFCSMIMACGYSNMSLQPLEVRYKTFRYVKKKYGKLLDKVELKEEESEENGSENIWICWFQGIESAPDIVKACVASVYEHMPDKKIHVITAENLSEYVELPEYILTKWKKGVITNTHLSDILRTELLIRYGGLWLDATTYLTDGIPDYVFKNKFFLYRYYAENFDLTIKYNSWFIYAERGNKALQAIRYLLYAYWKKEKKIREYFLWHFFCKLTADRFPELFKDVYYVLDDVPLHLGRNLTKPFDPDFWNAVTRMTAVHKLSYKRELPKDVSDTYYDYIINKKINP